MRKRPRWVWTCSPTVVGAALAGPPASAAPTRDSNCVHPSSGVSLNELFGVPEQFVSPICEGLTAGEHWRPTMSYFGADGSDAVYPQGYVPLHANPVDDVLAKITIKAVIDGGTRQQKTYTFSPTDEDASARMSGSTTSTRRFPTSRRSSSSPAWRRSAPATTPMSSSGCCPPRTATESALTSTTAASPPARTRSVSDPRTSRSPSLLPLAEVPRERAEAGQASGLCSRGRLAVAAATGSPPDQQAELSPDIARRACRAQQLHTASSLGAARRRSRREHPETASASPPSGPLGGPLTGPPHPSPSVVARPAPRRRRSGEPRSRS